MFQAGDENYFDLGSTGPKHQVSSFFSKSDDFLSKWSKFAPPSQKSNFLEVTYNRAGARHGFKSTGSSQPSVDPLLCIAMYCA